MSAGLWKCCWRWDVKWPKVIIYSINKFAHQKNNNIDQLMITVTGWKPSFSKRAQNNTEAVARRTPFFIEHFHWLLLTVMSPKMHFESSNKKTLAQVLVSCKVTNLTTFSIQYKTNVLHHNKYIQHNKNKNVQDNNYNTGKKFHTLL